MGLVDSTGAPIASTPLTEEQGVGLMVEEVRALTTPPILALQPLQFLMLVGLLQLAGRHPEISASARALLADIVAIAREYFKACPTILEVIELGEDPANDRPLDDHCDLECGDRFFRGEDRCRHNRTPAESLAHVQANLG